MKIYLPENVLEAARKRIRRIFAEFDTVVVNFSGGKDSTVVLNLALEAAEELGRLPLHVLWLDQEAEWESVVSYVRSVMADPRVTPLWFQGPFRIFNATSGADPWLWCWREGCEKDWIHPKDPLAIHENPTGVDRFAELFEAVVAHYLPGKRVAHLAGVRTDESPARLRGLTSYATYKDITWGSKKGEKLGQWTFHPLYDWTYIDVWKAIHQHGWRYCHLYDLMYQYGVPVRGMRVSNVHHETAVKVLGFMQELEPVTWSRVTERLAGVNAANHHNEFYAAPREVPPMFTSWRDYRDHLMANLVEDPVLREKFRASFDRWEANFDASIVERVMRAQVGALVVNDHEGTKFATFCAANGKHLRGRGKRAK